MQSILPLPGQPASDQPPNFNADSATNLRMT
jgi:hypothetical protein